MLLWVPADGYDPQRHLSMGDVRLDNRDKPSFLEVHIKYSKTERYEDLSWGNGE